jgi:hypothetical protein
MLRDHLFSFGLRTGDPLDHEKLDDIFDRRSVALPSDREMEIA